MPRLCIIIVSFNTRDDLAACLESLSSRAPRADHEVIVVDNASTDGSADMVRQRWPGVRVIDAGDNLGFARANNLAIRQSSSDLILLLNSDTIVKAGAIDTLVGVLDAHPGVAVVGPRLVNGTGRAEVSFGRMIGPLADLRQMLLVRGNDAGTRAIVGYVDRMTRREREVDWVTGACLLMRRSDAEAVGLLDERFFMYAEDVDLCAMIRARGRRILFTPAAEVVHLRGRSVAAAGAAGTADTSRRSKVALYEKHHPRWASLLRVWYRWRP